MSDRIVIVEDDHELRSFLGELLEESGYEPVPFATADHALRQFDSGLDADLVITDLILPGKRGHELLDRLRQVRPELNVIIITAFGAIDDAIRLIKKGAYDYLPKPFSPEKLLLVVKRALSESELRREVARLRAETTAAPAGFVAASRAMNELFALLRRAAESTHPVLISGESGTGKELAARALHQLSRCRAFVPVNCGALPENLLESELFGHEKGAFTGADRQKRGLFDAADGGILFLDEVGELPLSLQPKLLRAIEQGEVRPVGATEPSTVSVRIVAATNKDLEEQVRLGTFREDLFWRLNVLHIHIPPLRQRPADIPVLAEHFLASGLRRDDKGLARRIAPDSMAILTAYDWPGNVRELRNVVERAVTMARTETIRPEDLPERIREQGSAALLTARASERRLSLKELEHLYVIEILRQVGGNKSRAAEILGIDRKTLYRRLEEIEQEDTPALL